MLDETILNIKNKLETLKQNLSENEDKLIEDIQNEMDTIKDKAKEYFTDPKNFEEEVKNDPVATAKKYKETSDTYKWVALGLSGVLLYGILKK